MMHQQHMAVITSVKFDENAAKAMIKQERENREARREQRQLTKLKIQHDIYQILTAEQQQQYQQLMERPMPPKGPQRPMEREGRFEQGPMGHHDQCGGNGERPYKKMPAN